MVTDLRQFLELRCRATCESPQVVIKEDHRCQNIEAQRVRLKFLKCPGMRVLLELCLRQGRPSAVQALGVEEGYGAGSRK